MSLPTADHPPAAASPQHPGPGALVISLDFELFWGVRDHKTLQGYGANILGVRQAVPAMLCLFERYGVHATWATVGLLFFEERERMLKGLPDLRPEYENPGFSPYPHVTAVGANEAEDPYHFAGSLIREIAACPGQEIATHTFSHYYCLEPGQDVQAFRADLEAAIRAAQAYGITFESLVFPRNQTNEAYLRVCRECGIRVYRGNEQSWLYEARSRGEESKLRRALRLLDAYLPLTGHNCFHPQPAPPEMPADVPSSRFLRPYSRRLRVLEPLRLSRIAGDLTHAGRHGLVYHLWWHPHNFGAHLKENLAFLERVLQEFDHLRETLGMESLTMAEAAARAVEVR